MSKPSVILSILLLPLYVLSADSGPDTILTDDRVYVTTGSLEVPVPVKVAEGILTDYYRYNEWALKGMSGDEPSENWHIAWLQDCEYEPEASTMKIIFGLHILGALRSRNNRIRFLVTEKRHPSGNLERLSFTLADKSPFMKRAEYGVELSGDDNNTNIHYFGYVRLAPIVDIFFNLKIYKKNIAWYMVRMIQNFKNRLLSPEPPVS